MYKRREKAAEESKSDGKKHKEAEKSDDVVASKGSDMSREEKREAYKAGQITATEGRLGKQTTGTAHATENMIKAERYSAIHCPGFLAGFDLHR